MSCLMFYSLAKHLLQKFGPSCSVKNWHFDVTSHADVMKNRSRVWICLQFLVFHCFKLSTNYLNYRWPISSRLMDPMVFLVKLLEDLRRGNPESPPEMYLSVAWAHSLSRSARRRPRMQQATMQRYSGCGFGIVHLRANDWSDSNPHILTRPYSQVCCVGGFQQRYFF